MDSLSAVNKQVTKIGVEVVPAANYAITTNGDICCHDLAYVNQDGGDPAYYSLYASMKAKADLEHTHSRFENLGIGDNALVAYSLITAGKARVAPLLQQIRYAHCVW